MTIAAINCHREWEIQAKCVKRPQDVTWLKKQILLKYLKKLFLHQNNLSFQIISSLETKSCNKALVKVSDQNSFRSNQIYSDLFRNLCAS